MAQLRCTKCGRPTPKNDADEQGRCLACQYQAEHPDEARKERAMSRKSGAQRRREHQARALGGDATGHQEEAGRSSPPPSLRGGSARGVPAESLRGGAVQRRDAELFPLAEVRETIEWEAQAFVKAGLAGDRTLEQVIVLIVTGRDLGLPPSQALAGLYVEDGKVAMQADLMRALVLRSGTGIIEPVVVEEARCVVRAVRYGQRGRPDTTFEVPWTVGDAQKAGLLGKRSWKEYPRQMLFARATSEAARTLFSDVLCGVIYTPEELGGVAVPSPEAPAGPAAAVGPGEAPAVAGPVGSSPQIPPQPLASGKTPPKAPKTRTPPVSAPGTASGVPVSGPQEPPGAVRSEVKGVALPPVPPEAPAASGAVSRPVARHLTTTVLLDLPGGGVKTVLTAGLTKQQYQMLVVLTHPEGGYPGWAAAKAHGAAETKRRGLESALYLSEAEAAELIAAMSRLATERAQPASMPPDWLAARAKLDEVIAHQHLDPAETIGVVCRLLGVARLEDADATALKHGADHLREMAVTANDPAAVALVVEQLKHRAEIGG